MLPLEHSWPIRCAACGHKGHVSAAVADLASKVLACRACGHRQPFAPESIVRSTRAANGWRARPRRGRTATPRPVATTPDLPADRLDDLWAAG